MRVAQLSFGAASSVLFAVIAFAVGCESTVDLGGNVDAGSDRTTPPDSATGTTCDGVCRKLRNCGFIDDAASLSDCIAECNARATEQDLTCVARESCATIPSVCAGEAARDAGGDAPSPVSQFDITVCQSECRSAHSWDCISAADMSRCQSLCETSSKRRSYTDCASSSGSNCTKHRDCWNVFQQSQ